MPNILYQGTSCCSPNKGAAAMFIGATHSLRQVMPDADFAMLTVFLNCDSEGVLCRIHNIRQVNNNESLSIHNLLLLTLRQLRIGTWYILKRYVGLNLRLLIKERVLREYAEADVLIDLSGDTITDDYGVKQTLSVFTNLIPPILIGTPIIIFPQSIGPFKSRFTRLMARFFLNKVMFIVARESITQNYLERIGIKAPIYLAPDISLFVPPISTESSKGILNKEGIEQSDGYLIGISASQSISKFANSPKKYSQYVDTMAKIVDYLVEKLNATVVFVPQVIGPNMEHDDRIIGALIQGKVLHKERVICMTGEYQPEELKGIIGNFNLFLSARMHASIAALAMHVPIIAISYSHKTPGIMDMMGMKDYVIEFNNLTFEELQEKINKVWENREELRQMLELKMNKLSIEARRSVRLTEDLLSNNACRQKMLP